MLLQCFLLVFLFNVFSLKNPNEILSPNNQTSSVSLVESLKKDPLSFVEAFAQADPGKVNEVIDRLEILAAASSSNKHDLVIKSVTTEDKFYEAKAILSAAQKDLMDFYQVYFSGPQYDQEYALKEAIKRAEHAVAEASQAKYDAAENLAANGPRLDDELADLQKAIQALQLLMCGVDGYTSEKDSDGVYACYKFGDTKLNWFDARDACVADGAYLVKQIVTNYDANSLLIHGCGNKDIFWSGGNDINVEGTWVWSDETPITDTHFGGVQPDGGTRENCLNLRGCSGDDGIDVFWNDNSCNRELSYLCQK